ncbi:MAG: alpha/beta hydrolase [Alphaproteobacteria bacterium]|nr:alpha/beta hydrolase [Alphaproteobacteria bacterium]
MTTYVLVHGARHGGWCWRRVAKRLRAAGYDVFTPTLTGLDERSHLLTASVNMATHVQDIANVLRWEDLHDVVLVGLSYAGLVVTGPADAEADRVATLAYLDAFVPGDGESNWSLVNDLFRGLFMDTSGEMGYSVATIPFSLFGIKDAADQAWVDAKCTPYPLAGFRQSLKLTGAVDRIRDKVFILADGWDHNPFVPFHDQYKSKPGWTVHRTPHSHDAMVDGADAVADILLKSAR